MSTRPRTTKNSAKKSSASAVSKTDSQAPKIRQKRQPKPPASAPPKVLAKRPRRDSETLSSVDALNLQLSDENVEQASTQNILPSLLQHPVIKSDAVGDMVAEAVNNLPLMTEEEKNRIEEEEQHHQLMRNATAVKQEDQPVMKKRQRKVKEKKINYQEGSSDVASSMTGELRQRLPKKHAIIVYYDQFVKKADDNSSNVLTKMLHEMLQTHLISLSEEQAKPYHDQFEKVVLANFDTWRQANHKPEVWDHIQPKLMIDVILHKVTTENDIPATVLSHYAKLLISSCSKQSFDSKTIRDRTELSNHNQVRALANQIIDNCVSRDHLQKEYVTTRPAVLVLLIKLGQINIMFRRIFEIQGSFNQNFVQQEKNIINVADTDAKRNRNEVKLVAALRTVYPDYSLDVAKKFLEDENFRILAWPQTTKALHDIVDTRHQILLAAITKALIPPDQDPAETLLSINQADGGSDQWMLRLVISSYINNPQNQRFNSEDLQKLCQQLSLAGKVQASAIVYRFKEDLKLALNFLERGVNISPDVNKELVAKRVAAYVEQNPNASLLKQTMKEITEFVEDQIIKPRVIRSDLFELDVYQVYVAACICIGQKHYFGLLFAGQGKTIVMLLVGLWFIKRKQIKTVAVITSSMLLCNQLKRDLNAIWQAGIGQYFDFYHAERTDEIQPAELIMIDEADIVLQNFVTFSESAHLNGLYHLKKTSKALYLSATMPVYFKNLISNCFGDYSVTQFESQYQLSKNAGSPHKITDLNFRTKAEMLLQIKIEILDIGKQATKLPLLFFIEQWDQEIVDAISAEILAVYGSKLEIVQEESQLFKVATAIRSHSTGAILLETKFGRGLNIRFEGDCEVRVIANGDKLIWEDVCQMVGRSCRRFGLCVGRVYVLSGDQVQNMFRGGKDYLQRGDYQTHDDDGCQIAKQLFNKFELITKLDMRKEIIAAFDGKPPQWRTRRDRIKDKSQSVYRFLRDDDYRPTSKWL